MAVKLAYEEFAERVHKAFINSIPAGRRESAEEYFKGEEAKEMLQSDYKVFSKRFENGEITAEQFKGYAADTAAYNLYMMF